MDAIAAANKAKAEKEADKAAEILQVKAAEVVEQKTEEMDFSLRRRKPSGDFEEVEEFGEIEDFMAERARKKAQKAEITDVEDVYKRATRHRQKRGGFVETPDSEVYALRGDTVAIECELFNEHDHVNWTINNKPVSSDPRAVSEEQGYIRRLLIRNIVPDDTGLETAVELDGMKFTTKVNVDETPVEFTKKLERKIIAPMTES
uniref:Immunoglobulin I-set domain-containing protein n=1 Tax=Panagrolaimus davidi TaxID=227884 RepID=A0A914Q3L7_9BILA